MFQYLIAVQAVAMYSIEEKKQPMQSAAGGKKEEMCMGNPSVLENTQILNQFMTNEHLSFRVNNLDLDILWASFEAGDVRNNTGSNARHPKLHSHSFCETHLCTRGTVVYRLRDGREFVIHAGDTIFIRENVEHELAFDSDDALKISMAYRLTDGPALYNRPEGQQLLDVAVIPEATHIFSLYGKISQELSEQRLGYRDMICMLLFEITLEYERQITSVVNAAPVISRIDKRVDEINGFISANITKDITTMDVAEYMHLSKRQINRIILKEFATSCTGLIKQTKHKKAQELLLYSDKSIQDIATELGYGNVYSFSKFFKSQEGMPPALFRRSHYSY